MSQERKQWVGSNTKTCDICNEPITTEFVDGKTRWSSWANMCPSCFKIMGVGLGTGLGQQYKLEGGTFYKVTG